MTSIILKLFKHDEVSNHSVNLNIFLLVNYFHGPDDLWQAIPMKRCAAEADIYIPYDSTGNRTERSSHKRKNKGKIATKIEGQFFCHTFMVGTTKGNLLAYYASPIFLNWRRKEVRYRKEGFQRSCKARTQGRHSHSVREKHMFTHRKRSPLLRYSCGADLRVPECTRAMK